MAPVPPTSKNAIDVLRAASKPCLIGSIERLRGLVTTAENAPTATQLASVVAQLTVGADLDATAAAAGLSTTAVVDAISELGAWLSHNHGAAPIKVVPAGTLAQPPLFTLPAPPGSVAGDERPEVEIPSGFSPRALDRDVRAAYAAVVANQPSPAELQRFVDRTRRTGEVTPSYESVAAVTFFVRLGRTDALAQVSPKSVAFAALAVKSYDLVEVARADAISAMCDVLCAQADTEKTLEAVERASVLYATQLRRFARVLALPGDGPSASLLDREREALSQRILAAPTQWALDSPARLDDAQIRRISGAAGLDLDRDRQLEREIRQRLVDAGRGQDADVLIPAALDAVANGTEEAFWSRIDAG